MSHILLGARDIELKLAVPAHEGGQFCYRTN